MYVYYIINFIIFFQFSYSCIRYKVGYVSVSNIITTYEAYRTNLKWHSLKWAANRTMINWFNSNKNYPMLSRISIISYKVHLIRIKLFHWKLTKRNGRLSDNCHECILSTYLINISNRTVIIFVLALVSIKLPPSIFLFFPFIGTIHWEILRHPIFL